MPERSSLHLERAILLWRRVRGLSSRLTRATNATLAHLPLGVARVEFTLLLTSDVAVRRLNRDFRGMDKATNVLSFPQVARRQLSKIGKTKEPVYIGDIAIAYQYVVKDAKAEGKDLKDHVTHLLIHGLLHLFGYDHQTTATAVRMERLETKIMAELGLPDPYAVCDIKRTKR